MRTTGLLLLGLATAALAGPGATFKAKWVVVRGREAGVYTLESRMPVFPDRGVGRLANALMQKNDGDVRKGFIRLARESVREMPYRPKPYFHGTTEISVARPDLISGMRYIDTFYGGAHEDNNYASVNVGLVGGVPKPLALGNLVRRGVDARQLFGDVLMAKLRAHPRAFFVKDGSVKDASELTLRNWMLTPTAIAFIIPPYEAGPYSSGEVVVKVLYSELGDKLNRQGPLSGLLQ